MVPARLESESPMLNPDLILKIAAVVFVYMNLLFVLALVLRKNDIVDIAWGMGFILISIFSLMLLPAIPARMLLMSALVLIWGLRLALYIYNRNRGKKRGFPLCSVAPGLGQILGVAQLSASIYAAGILHAHHRLPTVYLCSRECAPPGLPGSGRITGVADRILL